MSDQLPSEITRTGIWKRTLAIQEGDIYKSRLNNAFIKFRERALILSKEISLVFPEFTVHDITHIDALWELADSIIGPDYPLTPAEAFVLGGAFLIHDLGMALAAYPGGREALYKTEIWQDTITPYLMEKLGHLPTKEEIDNCGKEVEDKTIEYVLRHLHAEIAEKLTSIEWDDGSPNSTKYCLIEDPEIRNAYGSLIGKIAHSHWWPVKKLDEEFTQRIVGAPSFLPKEWSVDALKIACILRVADASHLDSSRAPGFLKALRKPSKDSKEHWNFQEELYKPRVETDRFLYTSGNPFSIDKFNSWWLCYDTLREVDRELREVDSLLADKVDDHRPRFRVRSVAYIEDPSRLAKQIPTKGWIPVDANIKVSDVSSLVYSLGGEQLYGKDYTIPLRELIQNSIDAIKARRILDNRPVDWGNIIVRSGRDSEAYWIEIEDNGIGMSSELLKGSFLDFGTSYWGSQLMCGEHPGLSAKGFQSIGKYGIGFFSVFMWGKHVKVTTCRYDYGKQDTLVLEFDGGVKSRPILRKAQRNEYLREGGTCIRVWTKNKLQFKIPAVSSKSETSLDDICLFIAPSIEVNLYVQGNDEISPRMIISASNWITLNNKDLCNRMLIFSDYENRDKTNFLNAISENIKPLTNAENQIVGRACIALNRYDNKGVRGAVTVGGLYSCFMDGIFGIFTGKPITASRKSAEPSVGIQELQKWATEQSKLVSILYSEDWDLVNCSKIIRNLGGNTLDLPIASLEDGWKNKDEIFKWARAHDEIIIIDYNLREVLRNRYDKLVLHKNVLTSINHIQFVLKSELSNDWPPLDNEIDPRFSFYRKTLEGAVIETIAESWSVSLRDLLNVSDLSAGRLLYKKEVGTYEGEPAVDIVDVIRNPKVYKDKRGIPSSISYTEGNYYFLR